MIYNVALVSGVQSDSVIHKYTYILFHIISYYILLPTQDIEYSSLYYAVGPFCLSILYSAACICQSQTPNLSLPLASTFPFGNHKFVFYVYESFCFINKSVLYHICESIYVILYDICPSLSEKSLYMIISKSIQVTENGVISCFFMTEM